MFLTCRSDFNDEVWLIDCLRIVSYNIPIVTFAVHETYSAGFARFKRSFMINKILASNITDFKASKQEHFHFETVNRKES